MGGESNMLGKLVNVASSIQAGVSDASSAAKKQAENLNQTIRSSAQAIENKVIDTKNDVVDFSASVAEAGSKSIKTMIGIASLISEVGLIIGSITAPVPTLIGVCLLWLIKFQVEESIDSFDHSMRDRRQDRKAKKVAAILKQYGQIPENAVIRTDLFSMSINVRTGVITGMIMAGALKGRSLDTLTVNELRGLIGECQDEESSNLLEAYLAIRS